MLSIKVQKINEDALIPKYAHKHDAGMDLYSIREYILKPRHRILVRTGLKLQVPRGYEMQIRPKSGLALKNGVTVLNTPGTVDSDYRGEIGVILINHSNKSYRVEKNQKIAQAVFNKIEIARLTEANKVNRTKRNEGGFGSTGLK